eukprot:3932670-Amphidinium_carterae.1
MPTAEKLQFEQKYTYGMGQLPPAQAFVEEHMRFALMAALPKNTMERIEAYGQTAVPDVLFVLMKEIFPNKDNLRLAMSEEVNRLPFDKSTISFYRASLILEDWIQK